MNIKHIINGLIIVLSICTLQCQGAGASLSSAQDDELVKKAKFILLTKERLNEQDLGLKIVRHYKHDNGQEDAYIDFNLRASGVASNRKGINNKVGNKKVGIQFISINGMPPYKYHIVYSAELVEEHSSANRIREAVVENRLDVARRLISEGVSVEVKDVEGCSLLMNAISMGHGDMAKLLIDAGADINATNNSGTTPLIAACDSRMPEIVNILLKQKVNPNTQDAYGVSPLIAAASMADEKIMTILLVGGAKVNTLTQKGESALSWAVVLDKAELVRLLLKHQADVNLSEAGGLTPLSLAARMGGRKEVIEIIKRNGGHN